MSVIVIVKIVEGLFVNRVNALGRRLWKLASASPAESESSCRGAVFFSAPQSNWLVNDQSALSVMASEQRNMAIVNIFLAPFLGDLLLLGFDLLNVKIIRATETIK